MDLYALLFAFVSFASVLLYYPIADAAKLKNRGVRQFHLSYWNAFQCFIWSLGVILMRGGPSVDISAIIPVLPTMIIYSVISELPEMSFDLTGGNFTTTQIAVLSTVGVLVGLFILIIIILEPDKSTLFWKFLPLIIFLAWSLSWIGIAKSQGTESATTPIMTYWTTVFEDGRWRWVEHTVEEEKQTNFILHFHHWMIGVAGFLACISSSTYSQFISGIFWGVFCHEAAAYGIMIPSKARQTYEQITTQKFI
jgi:hypothetical protein